LCKNTWMFPFYEGKHAAKSEPDTIDTVKKLVAQGTAPAKLSKVTIIDLAMCPFWQDEQICPLKERFLQPRDNLNDVQIQYLKYPILCKFANSYRCRYVKKYYYSYKEFKLADNGTPTDEDDLNLKGEED